jgi:cytochrome P450
MDTSSRAAGTVGELLAELAAPDGQANPYPIYRRLRTLGDSVTAPDGALVVTGYRPCSALLRDNRLRKNPARLLVRAGYENWQERPGLESMFNSLLMINPPDHTRLRRIVAGAFTARRVAGLSGAVSAIADELLDGLGERDGEVDFVDAIAFPFPVTVIGELLGIPPADRAKFQQLVHDWSMVLEILSPPSVDRADAAALEIRDYLGALAQERRAAPRDDLISALVAAEDEEARLSEHELVTMAALILAAGFETTTGLLANGLLALLAHPAEAARLREDSTVAKSGAEELLRYDSPVQMIYGRSAPEDMTVGATTVKAGQRVITVLGAANRDPAVFTAPDALDLRRHEAPVLSFGAGIHHCLGAALARLEAQVMLPRLLQRFPSIALAGDPVPRGGNSLHGYTAVPVTLT